MRENPAFHFCLVAHSQEIVDCIVPVVEEDPTIELRTLVATSDTLLDIAQEELAHGQEIILCHGGTGNAIVKAIGQKVVLINRTDMDVIKALLKAKKFSTEIGVATYLNEPLDVKAVESLLGIHLHPINYVTWQSQVKNVEALYERGVRVMVGGGTSAERMTALGGVGIVIMPSVYSIRQALQYARQIALHNRAERRQLRELETILNQLREGIVCTDSAGRRLFANDAASRLLGLDGNIPWQTVTGALLLSSVLTDGKPREEEIITFRSRQLIVGAAPLFVNGRRIGALSMFSDASNVQKMNRKITEKHFNQSLVARYSVDDILGTSADIIQLRERIRRFAPINASVHIHGETGTGKERIAHAIHTASTRAGGPFVAVNISSLSESLMESELFGYEEGAFTGARHSGKPGLFELADGGTLFLDEIGDLSLPLQLRLLRVLESKEVMRLGGTGIVHVNVRIVSATHRDLLDLIRWGKFRMDLYFRLSDLTLEVPPLRKRTQDIPLLCEDTLRRHAFPPRHLTPAMITTLNEYEWPGNVRELLALVNRYCILNDNDGKPDETLLIELVDHQRRTIGRREHNHECQELSLKDELTRIRREMITEFITSHDGNRRLAAESLGVSYTTLWREMREWENLKD